MHTPKILAISLAFILLSLSSHAKNENIDSCGKIETVSGATCKTATVKFNLINCEDKISIVKAKVTCEKNNMTAVFKTNKFNYRQSFTVEKTWSNEVIIPKGKLWRAVRKNYLESIKDIKIQ